jgi:hypothetical protein
VVGALVRTPHLNVPPCRRVKVPMDIRLKFKMLATGNSPRRKSETELVAYIAHGPTIAVHQCGDGGFLRPKPCHQLRGQFRKYRINLFCLTLRQYSFTRGAEDFAQSPPMRFRQSGAFLSPNSRTPSYRVRRCRLYRDEFRVTQTVGSNERLPCPNNALFRTSQPSEGSET